MWTHLLGLAPCSWSLCVGVGAGVQLGELSTVEAKLVTLEDKLLGLRDLDEAELLLALPAGSWDTAPGSRVRDRDLCTGRSLEGALTGRTTLGSGTGNDSTLGASMAALSISAASLGIRK